MRLAPDTNMVVPYKQFNDRSRFDTIVIGSGIGGLGAAALLAKAGGQRVLVLERHFTPGGFTHAFRRPGFEWDVGLHYVGQVHLRGSQARALFDYLAEGRLEWQSMPDVYDRVIVGDLRFDYVRGESRLRDGLKAAFPLERRAVDRYFSAIRRCMRRMPLFFVEKVLPPLPARLLGGAMRAPFLALARRTTASVLDDIGASSPLRAILTAQWGDYGLPPKQSSFGIHALVTSHYFEGAAYPVGGARQIADSLIPTIEKAGGRIVVAAEVGGILLQGDRAVGVRMSDGQEFRARHIVSDVGAAATLRHLLPGGAPGSVGAVARRLANLQPSIAHVCLYVGVDRRKLKTPLDGTNLWIHPDVDFDRNLARVESDCHAPFPFLFISFPSAKDATFATRHPGHDTVEVVTVMPFSHFTQWSNTQWRHRGEEYDVFKRTLACRLLTELRRHVPTLEDAIVAWELSTPVSTQHFANAERGQIYGLAHSPGRFLTRDLRPRTPIHDLYLTGQDVATCGVMGALSGAVTTATAMLGRNLFSVADR
jgi:all-trans-retinol 13,14-reductase